MINDTQFSKVLRQTIKRLFCILLCFISSTSFSQNDDCADAIEITIPNGGFDLGAFTSSTNDISTATIQTGEDFAPAILVASQNKKSIWYKFTLPTARNVKVILSQPGVDITAGDAGFAIYKSNSCLPPATDISTKLTPIATFGNTKHPCVETGDYLIQVSSNTKANGLLSIQLEISAATGSAYDYPSTAYSFGTLAGNMTNIDFTVDCQSIDDATEVCTALSNYQEYTKSTWHTFTTPAYLDFLSVFLASDGNPSSFIDGTATFGYNLYQGDIQANPVGSLTKIGECDSLVTDGYHPDYKLYRCGVLEPSTVYTIQLFYHKDFNDDVRLAINVEGLAPTQAPQAILSTVPASNQLGILPASPAGIKTTATDYLACNSNHALHPCAPTLPAIGIDTFGITYNLSTFYTFELTTATALTILARMPRRNDLLVSLYKQELTNTCSDLNSSSSLVSRFKYNGTINCLSPGQYTLQISGSDSLLPYNHFNYSNISYDDGFTMLSNLGQQIDLTLTAKILKPANTFSLATDGAYDSVNVSAGAMEPLQNGTLYTAAADTFGCANTVLPKGINACYPDYNKAIYREFVIGDADGNGSADSGIVSLSYYGHSGDPMGFMLYKGNANSLAIANNKHSSTDSLVGLNPYTDCLRYHTGCGNTQVCLTPGAYSFVTLGNDVHVGKSDRPPTMEFNMVTTTHYNGVTAQNLGSILDTLTTIGGNVINSDIDLFSCKDNAVTINKFSPPVLHGHPATKAIYRQFYLNAPAIVSICPKETSCYDYGGYIALFAGQATAGLNELAIKEIKGSTFTSRCISPSTCDPLSAGWYTVVSYGTGPTYDSVLKHVSDHGYGSYIGVKNQLKITVTLACPAPKYNRPHKACIDTLTNAPFLIEWKPRIGSTPAYPITDTTYTLYSENLNCSVDTPFTSHPLNPCDTLVNRVAYYVFELTQESYVKINTHNYMAELFDKDVRTDSVLFPSLLPIQPCIKKSGYIQLCRLQPGTYTLVVFAYENQVSNGCGSISAPTIYIDKVGYSRFDHANKAYDFGVIPSDSVYYNGKPGDVNPLDASRAASNDFFYCTTGSQLNDPSEATCRVKYNSEIYNAGVNNDLYNVNNPPYSSYITRRNLWYTFVIDKPGFVHVKVDNKTAGKMNQYRFAIYKSDADGTLPFTTLAGTGEVDSTSDQGLDYMLDNRAWSYCNGSNEMSFYRDPCIALPAERYYVVVDNQMSPNHQVEVSVMLDSTTAIVPKFDHYYQASDMGTLEPGIHIGETDNFSCATSDATDPNLSVYSCGKKTLWYKFTSTVTGHVQYHINVNGTTKYNYDAVQLFRETVPGDSTINGLKYIKATSYNNGTKTVAQTCISAGTYYLLVTGCNQTIDNEFPEIEIIEEEGDFCGKPIISPLNGTSTSVTTAIIDCHTIGTDYGEFSPNLTCPTGAVKTDYKSSWFRMDISGTDTLDVTAFVNENTTATSSDIQYRLMTGDCGAMQEQSCVQDAQTQNTYKCLAPGSYFIQVFTPVRKNNYLVTGSVDLNLSAIIHADTCAPSNSCLANANFIPQFDCNMEDSATFVNYSTFGTAIEYLWDFGYASNTSTGVSPRFKYPALATDETYTITLNVKNTACAGENTVTNTIDIPGRSDLNLGKDTSICEYGGTLLLDATSWPGSEYYWFNGSTDSIFNVTSRTGAYRVEVTYNGCSKKDTITVDINPFTSIHQNNMLCGNDSISLNSNRGYGETFLWSTGETTNSIYAKTAGTYINNVSLNGCVTLDTFDIKSLSTVITYHDTTVCPPINSSFILDKTANGAQSYSWENGSGEATNSVITEGLYWVSINYGSCVVIDTSNVTFYSPAVTENTTSTFCFGQNYLLPWGTSVNTPGEYSDTLFNSAGCDSLIKNINLTEIVASDTIRTFDTIFWGQPFTLPWGVAADSNGVYSDTLLSSGGCDSLIQIANLYVKAVAQENKDLSLCYDKTYTLNSGNIASTSGIYYDTLRYLNGYDSVKISYNIDVSTLSPTLLSSNETICQGQTFIMPSGKSVSATAVYSDTLRYATGCDSVIESINLIVQSPIDTTVNEVICPGESYVLSSGVEVSTAGVYMDTLHYFSGCDSVIKTINLSIQSSVTITNDTAICIGKSSSLTANGSASYLWSNKATTDTATVSPKNTTTYTVTGTTGTCVSSATVKITVNPIPVVAVNSQTICEGQAATFFASGAESYRWSDNSTDNPLVTNPATSTNHTVTGTSAGCKATAVANVTITQVPEISVNTDTICLGESALLTASGASIYDWSTGVIGSFSSVSPVSTTTYTVSTTIAGCSKFAYPIVKVNLPPIVKVNSPTICEGLSSTLTASGATSYIWSTNSSSNSLIVSPISTTSYTVTGSILGCLGAAISTITVYPAPLVSVNSASICRGINTVLTANGASSYIWSTGETTRFISVLPTSNTSYTVTGYDPIGCGNEAVGTITILPTPDANFTFNPDPAGHFDPVITFRDSSKSNVNYWKWDFGDGDILEPNIPNPVHTYPYIEEVYIVTLLVKNPGLCRDSISHEIVVGQEFTFFIPNAFSPNNDNVNDEFGASGEGIVKFEMTIFDRWGSLVFKTDEMSNTWKGKLKDGKTTCMQDVYVWKVALTDVFKKQHEFIGTVVIVN